MENIRHALETLGKPEEKTKFRGECDWEINSVKIGYSFKTCIKITILFLDLIFTSRVIRNIRMRGFQLRVVNRDRDPDPDPDQLLTPMGLLSQSQPLVKPITRAKVIMITRGPVHTTPEKFENPTITSHFRFVFEENSGRKAHEDREVIVFGKLRSQNIFLPY